MRYSLAVFLFFLFISCDSGNGQLKSEWSEAQVLQKREKVKEVMAIHDEAMPWMDEIHSLRKKIEERKTTSNSDSLTYYYDSLLMDLDNADNIMMTWMRRYKEPNDTGKLDLALGYLENEKIEISKVRDQMAKAIQNAKDAINK